MLKSHVRNRSRAKVLLALGVFSALGTTGCQIDVNGQTLPSPYYLKDDIQYFPPGPEFKLSREAAAQKAFNEDQALQQENQPTP